MSIIFYPSLVAKNRFYRGLYLNEIMGSSIVNSRSGCWMSKKKLLCSITMSADYDFTLN